MKRTLLACLALLAGASADLRAGERDDRVDVLAADLASAVAADDASRQLAVLAGLRDSGSVASAEALVASYAAGRAGLEQARALATNSKYEFERKEEVLAIVELRRVQEPELEDLVLVLDQELGQLERQLHTALVDVERYEGACVRILDTTSLLFDDLEPAKRRKAERRMLDMATEDDAAAARFGALVVLGSVGSEEAAAALLKRLALLDRESTRLEQSLAKARDGLRRMEDRLQREPSDANRSGDRAQPYRAALREPTRWNAELSTQRVESSLAAEAVGCIIARSDEVDQEKLLSLVVARRRGASRRLQLDLFDVLRAADCALGTATLHAELAHEKDALFRAQAIDGLTVQRSTRLEPLLLEAYLEDPSPHVRSRAITALATLRSKAAIPRLIARFERESGRQRAELAQALTSLTGESFRERADLWKAWWDGVADSFAVPRSPQRPRDERTAEQRVGTTLFGIHTTSRSVVFLLDLSGSMRHAMIARTNPTDDPRVPPDLPLDGEDSRLDVAKRELIRALAAIPEGGSFNVIVYASGVHAWRDEMSVLTPETRAEAIAYLDRLSADGATNISGAFERAFELTGIPARGEWTDPAFDTLYLLSDGRPSIGTVLWTPDLTATVTDRNRLAGITIHTIGLSGAQDTVLLQGLAARNGGSFVAR